MKIEKTEALFEINNVIFVNAWINEFKNSGGLRQAPVCVLSQLENKTEKYMLTFCEHQEVPHLTMACLQRLKNNLANLQNLKSLPHIIATFFFEFVFIIHPFMNGNGRTAKFIIDRILQDYNTLIPSYILIDKYALCGDMEKDFQNFREIIEQSVV